LSQNQTQKSIRFKKIKIVVVSFLYKQNSSEQLFTTFNLTISGRKKLLEQRLRIELKKHIIEYIYFSGCKQTPAICTIS